MVTTLAGIDPEARVRATLCLEPEGVGKPGLRSRSSPVILVDESGDRPGPHDLARRDML
jgi:hypothetical protein